MNYYEELGVARSASLAEIRQAYKALVRVVHPDQQQDETLKRLSELQLRRLNHILQILSDPLQRREYDWSLEPLSLVPVQPVPDPRTGFPRLRAMHLNLRWSPGTLVWFLIAAIAICTLVYWIKTPQPADLDSGVAPTEKAAKPARRAASSPSGSPQSSAASEQDARNVSRPHSPITSAQVKPLQDQRATVDSASLETAPVTLARTGMAPTEAPRANQSTLQESLHAPQTNSPKPVNLASFPGGGASNTAAPVPAPSSRLNELAPALPASVSKLESSISGNWLYVPQHEDVKKGMYPPEYIEMRITHRSGLLQGRYHARYKINDRPISPEINFQFEGRQGDAVSVLPWSSSTGAKGELRLKRISNDRLEVNWITTTFGQANTLASGSAVLYRSDP